MYSDILRDNLFPNMFVSANFDDSINRSSLILEMENVMSENSDSESYSNEGGYHSPGYWLTQGDKPILEKLADTALKFVYGELNYLKWDHNDFRVYYWFMVNELNNYNIIHQHGTSDLIGVYYAEVPECSGELSIIRNDGIAYSNLFSRNGQDLFELKPEAGRFYLMPGHMWHFVRSSRSTKRRMSVAFNFSELVLDPLE